RPRDRSFVPPTRRSLCISGLHATDLFFFFRIRRPPSPPLFPYTTLFRSLASTGAMAAIAADPQLADVAEAVHLLERNVARASRRSEEHTSELQSRENLVCRLLLEKKKKYCG